MGFGKDNKGAIIRETGTATLGTLAQNTALAIGSAVTTNLQSPFRILKTQVFAAIEEISASAQDKSTGSGLLLGIANGELTVAEIAEAFTVDGPTDRNERLQQEKAERGVFLIGMFKPALIAQGAADYSGTTGDTGSHHPNMQLEVVHKQPWTYLDPEAWQFFVYNIGIALNTGGKCKLVATHFGVWV